MDKDSRIREELDEWLAAGKIDRATYDRLMAEQLGEPGDAPAGPGLLTGAAGLTLGMGVCVLLINHLRGDTSAIWQSSLAGVLALTLVATWLARRTGLGEVGRALAIASSCLWILGLSHFAADYPDRFMYPSSWWFCLCGGLFTMAYLTTSALVATMGAALLVPGAILYLLESSPEPVFGHFMAILLALGLVDLIMAREHLVWRSPRAVWLRFAMGYQIVGLMLINWALFFLSWNGWNGDGYEDVTARIVCVTLTVGFYSLEVWAGQNSRMPWVSALGIGQFLFQIQSVLSYHHLSVAQRAVLVIVYALLLIVISQGESASRRGPR